jgi:hypothetical protein
MISTHICIHFCIPRATPGSRSRVADIHSNHSGTQKCASFASCSYSCSYSYSYSPLPFNHHAVSLCPVSRRWHDRHRLLKLAMVKVAGTSFLFPSPHAILSQSRTCNASKTAQTPTPPNTFFLNNQCKSSLFHLILAHNPLFSWQSKLNFILLLSLNFPQLSRCSLAKCFVREIGRVSAYPLNESLQASSPSYTPGFATVMQFISKSQSLPRALLLSR